MGLVRSTSFGGELVELTGTAAIIHQRTRLAIMGLVYRHRDVSFTRARDALGLTDGNLASHAKRLEEAGLLKERRALRSTGFETRYTITREGSRAFQAYLEQLRAYLDRVDQPTGEGSTPKSDTASTLAPEDA